jgi:murein L,D-transpeptidase YafK
MHRNVLRPFVLIATSFALLTHAQQPPVPTTQADRIVVVKSTHTMTLYAEGKVLKVYHVSLGSGASGNAKQMQGDHETPEGAYTINGRNAHSSCHLALHISYPNAADRERARKLGVDPGGDVMIHGLPPGYDGIKPGQELADWTWGCIGLTNAEMDEVWKLVPNGTPIEIRH